MTYIPSPAKDFVDYAEAPAAGRAWARTPVAVPANVAPAARKIATEAAPALPAPALPASPRKEAPRKGLWSRFLESVWTSRQRQADREIARYLSQHGGQLTDSAEREINRRLAGQGRFPID